MLLLACLLMSIGLVTAQTSTVSGVVPSDEDGEPVIGASVLVVGTSLGTVTDIDGRFTISNVPGSAKHLKVSFVGMQSQEVGIKHGTMHIVLKSDTEVLDEVMVVAFGTQKKSSFTGSAAVMSNEELSKHITTNVANALVGSTPGLQLRGGSGAPGASQGSIKIRGIASMYAATDPLIIVDGAPYSASLSNIAQEDIESVTVLKDAASAALYGARGAAGVILVTTKSGKSKKAQVNVDVKWGANTRAIQDYETIDDPGQYYETIYSQYYNHYYYGLGQNIATANANANNTMLTQLGYNIYTVPDGEFLIGSDGRLNPNATLGRSYEANGETYYLINDNWRDAAYSTALRQEYNVSVNGANDKGAFYASLNYLDEDGIIEYSGFKRLSARVKADYQALEWLKLGANIGYTNSKTESNPNLGTSWNSTNLMYYTSRIAPIYPIYVRVLDANGNPQIRTDANGNPQYDYGVAASNYPGLTRAFLPTGNPLGSNRYNDTTSEGQKFNGTFTLDLNFTDFAIDEMDEAAAVEALSAYSDVPDGLLITAEATPSGVVGGLEVKFRPANGEHDNQYAAFVVSVPLMRVEEMKLIEIEAAGMQNEARGIQLLTDFGKTRDPEFTYGEHAEGYGSSYATTFQNEVWWQRRVELWGEGFAMFDIKRLDKGIIRSYANTNHPAGYRWNYGGYGVNEGVIHPNWMDFCIVQTETNYNVACTNNPTPLMPTGDSPEHAW